MDFRIGMLEFDYYDHPHNTTARNERCLELPIAFWFLDHIPAPVIEIGAVTPYYRLPRHVVIDPYDEHPFSTKEDACEVDFLRFNVLSISTVEHISTGEYGPIIAGAAFELVVRIAQDATLYLITWPSGFNLDLDRAFARSGLKHAIFQRTGEQEWRQATFNPSIKYGHPFDAGNQLVLVTNIPELL